MKKIFLMFMMLVSLNVYATEDNYAKFEYAFRDYDGEDANKNGANIVLGTKLTDMFGVEGKLEGRASNGEDSNISKRIEGALVTNLGNGVYVKTGIGEKIPDSGSSYSYYAIEPGYKFELTKDINLGVSYRFRDAFDSHIDDETHQAKISAEYELDKTSSALASFGRSWGDSHYNSLNLGYAIKF